MNEADIVSTVLDAGPVPRDGVLMVHSAFRGLSRMGARAEPFCEALLAALPGGTVLMPAMTWRNVTPAQPVFDELLTPSHTGVLGETFRLRYASHRSLHPTHSTAGYGPGAAALLGGHHRCATPCAADSPYGLLRGQAAWILLLGVGLESCTAIHHGEETIAPEDYLEPVEPQPYQLIDRQGVTHEIRLRRHRRLARNFARFAPSLAAKKRLFQGRAGETAWMLFPADDLYQTVFEALVSDPRATLAL